MATFTMMLNELLGVDNPRDADPARIGLDDYPIWDHGYRGELNQKIIMRFWNREIGFETPSMFVHHMRRLMGEIMPYYNELAKTTLMRFDPFETLNVTHETEGETTGETKGTTSSDTESETHTDTETESTESSQSDQSSQSETASRNVNSDHPQTRLNEYEDYATSSAEAVSESVSSSDGSSSGTQSGTGTSHDRSTGAQTGEQETEQQQHHKDRSHQYGTQGNKSQMLQDYRDTILGVDVLILDELEVLFMGVWDTDQSYTRLEVPNLYANPYWYTGL